MIGGGPKRPGNFLTLPAAMKIIRPRGYLTAEKSLLLLQ